MKQEHIAIKLTEQGTIPYLSSIYSEGLPEGIVLNKTICGLGATYSCIKKACHTIIIELNLPVIQSKAHAPIHTEDNLFGVIGGTKTEDIVSYIMRTLKKGKFINILCTPESYYKLQDALIETMGDTYYSKIFFVLDEIQKYVIDDGYRDFSLNEIMEEFWKYDKRSVVSATPLLADDPRYQERNMKEVILEPEWDFKSPLSLILTNDVGRSLNAIISENIGQTVFIACNSVKLIRTYIRDTQTEHESVIFCARETAREVEHEEVCVYSDWNADNIKRINWMTSRFWTGFDLDDIPKPPIVIMLSDPTLVEHTMIDPTIDAVQIVGRFRNGISKIYHISNINASYKYRTVENIKGYLDAHRECYNKIRAMIEIQEDDDFKIALREVIDNCTWNKCLNGNGEINHLTVSHYAHKLHLQSTYSSYKALEEIYQKAPFITTVKMEIYDDRVLKIKKMPGRWRQRKEMMKILDQLKDFENGKYEEYLQEFQQIDRWFIDAYCTLGSKIIKQCHYKTSWINHEISKCKANRNKLKAEVAQTIKASFVVGGSYKRNDIKSMLNKIYRQYNIKAKAKASDIKLYFDVKECKIHGESAYKLIEPLF